MPFLLVLNIISTGGGMPMNNKRKLEDSVFNAIMYCRKELKTIKNLKEQLKELEENDLDDEPCPKCGGMIRKNSSECDQCGFVSEDRQQALTDIANRRKTLTFQIAARKDDVNKAVLFLSIILVPIFLVICFLLIV
jgi:DNA repair exonuclease SbcCD ATPase subunit